MSDGLYRDEPDYDFISHLMTSMYFCLVCMGSFTFMFLSNIPLIIVFPCVIVFLLCCLIIVILYYSQYCYFEEIFFMTKVCSCILLGCLFFTTMFYLIHGWSL